MEAIAAAVGAFVVIAAVGALIYGRMVFQSLLGLRKNLETAFAELEALLKQQFDLLPGLVSVCTANMRDEPRPLLDLARSRNAWSVAQTQEEKWDAGADTNHALQQLFIESEAYPALLADDRFLRLREILKGLAAKVADRRERYNAPPVNSTHGTRNSHTRPSLIWRDSRSVRFLPRQPQTRGLRLRLCFHDCREHESGFGGITIECKRQDGTNRYGDRQKTSDRQNDSSHRSGNLPRS